MYTLYYERAFVSGLLYSQTITSVSLIFVSSLRFSPQCFVPPEHGFCPTVTLPWYLVSWQPSFPTQWLTQKCLWPSLWYQAQGIIVIFGMLDFNATLIYYYAPCCKLNHMVLPVLLLSFLQHFLWSVTTYFPPLTFFLHHTCPLRQLCSSFSFKLQFKLLLKFPPPGCMESS